MTLLRLVALVLASLTVGAAAAALVSRDDHVGGSEARIDSRRFDEGSLVVTFAYGLNERVDVSADLRGPDIVVGVRRESGEGETPMIALSGRVTFGRLRCAACLGGRCPRGLSPAA